MKKKSREDKIYIGAWIPKKLHKLYIKALTHADLKSSDLIRRSVEKFVLQDIEDYGNEKTLPVWRRT